jgi:hypothetical protein
MSYYPINTEKPTFLFIHIPKTAGTSIGEWMYKFYGHHNVVTHKHAPISYKNFKDIDMPSFCVVRNPFSRAVSLYQELGSIIHENRLESIFNITNITLKDWEKGFDYFIQHFFEIVLTQYKDDIPISPSFTQLSYITINDVIKVDNILRFENLSQDFKQIQTLTNHHVDLDKWKVGKFDYLKNYKTVYTDNSKRLIEDFYKEDLEKFNYIF